jgi:hypothetical protein
MRSPVERHSEEAERVVPDIWRTERRQYSPEEKVLRRCERGEHRRSMKAGT